MHTYLGPHLPRRNEADEKSARYRVPRPDKSPPRKNNESTLFMLTRHRRSNRPVQRRPDLFLPPSPFARSRVPDAASPLGGSSDNGQHRWRIGGLRGRILRTRRGEDGIRRPVNLDQLEFGDEEGGEEGILRRHPFARYELGYALSVRDFSYRNAGS